MSRHQRVEQYELLPRTSQDSSSSFDNSIQDHDKPSPANSTLLTRLMWHFFRLHVRPARSIYTRIRRQRGSRGLLLRGFCWTLISLVTFTAILVVFTFAFRPSYTFLPDHYQALQRRCVGSKDPGRGNINNEKIFIAAALHDPGGTLVGKDWGNAVLELVELLGPQNVHLSIYENDADPLAKAALESMEHKVNCNSSLLSEHLPLEQLPRVRIPSGQSRIKRIAFLAEVRNRALRPLEIDPSIRFDKLLFINDVIFNPVDAAHLLFSTNYQPSGYTQYQAACAVDFINAFKFYDRYATRDFEGYTTGIPFFPWFTDAGHATSRRDVLGQRDAVRVRACWGGMTAFEAKWFQKRYPETSAPVPRNDGNDAGSDVTPLRFRYEKDPFWDASECCLIHADLTYLRHGHNTTTDSGIFMNPYVRVAYDSSTLRWLPYTRRIERLYSLVHTILNHVVGMPEYNPRRLEFPGDEVVEKVWKYGDVRNTLRVSETGGKTSKNQQRFYEEEERVADPGRFCGTRRLMVLNENPKKGQKNWEDVRLPPIP